MKQKIILLDDLAVNMRKAMYPDILLLEEGEEIRGKIINESLAKISIHTLWGPKTEIPRERVKYAVYATEDEAQFAALLDANLPQITERMTRVKTELTEFEQQVESERILSAGRIPGGEAIPAERTSEMAADDATSPADRSVHIPFREQAWDVIYDCDAEDIHSFSDDIFSVTTGDVVNSAVCTVIASTAEPLQGTPDTIEMLAAIYRETTSNQGRAQLSLEITFTDGSSITYRLFDSRGDRVDTQDYETDHRLIIRRPDLLLVVNENWQEIRMPVRQDAGTFIEDPAISAIRITHTQEGPATGVFESRCRSLVVNMQEMSSNAE
jgi:hypothetical protein